MPLLKIIVGATAVGKTDYSIEQALHYNSPIISCDSRQIYKEMTIGTAVPSALQLNTVKHYFIHSHSVKNLYSAGQYEVEALKLVEELFNQGHETLIMTGGSGFYVDAFCNGLDNMPDADLQLRETLTNRVNDEGLQPLLEELYKLDPKGYEIIDRTNPQRVVRALEVCLLGDKPYSQYAGCLNKNRKFDIEILVINRDRQELYNRINQRVDLMMDMGLLEEAKSLLPLRDYTGMRTVGYKELFDYFDGNISLDKAIEQIKTHTRNYAKRQITWWKRYKQAKWIQF